MQIQICFIGTVIQRYCFAERCK
uniref:Uncharacterized protein n=1 Tax=Anguilla anguilla TaxID=7936 RepID=A0A0E9S8D8_ANGAN